MKREVKLTAAGFGIVLGLPPLYLATALVLSWVPVNIDSRRPDEGIELFLISNGVHVDIVAPARTPAIDWTELFPAEHFVEIPSGAEHIGFGWGDKEFYISTPTWGDLTAGTAVRAMLWNSRSAMHVTYYRDPERYPDRRRLLVTPEQYASLIERILSSFQRDDVGEIILVPVPGYKKRDAFYEAKGSYTLFNTCNTWTGRVLRGAGLRMGYWTPFAFNVLYFYR